MEIYVCVRRTLDWSDEAHVAANILPRFRSRFELWNGTFAMSYAAFRLRLRQIAASNLDRLEGTRVAGFEEAVAAGRAGADAWIVPIDDDDWLAPGLPAGLRETLAGAREPGRCFGIYWIREVIAPPGRRRRLKHWLHPRRRGRFTCHTNDYALHSGCDDLEALFRSHVRASEAFDAAPDRVLELPRLLAIQNRNLASQTALGWRQESMDRDELLERYRAYRRFYAGWRLRGELRWAQPCVDAMAELMDELRPR